MSNCTTKTKPIEINGAVLTEEAINIIKTFQEENNVLINNQLETISDAITFIAIHANGDAEDKQMKKLVQDLSFAKTFLKDLKKPIE